MKHYSKKEDEIIVATLRRYSKKGAPLNIRAALDEAGDKIYDTLGVNRSLASLSVRYYGTLKDQYDIFGYKNTKNTFARDVVVPATVIIGGKPFTLTLNLAPALIRKLQES